jgi:hypothetical protein
MPHHTLALTVACSGALGLQPRGFCSLAQLRKLAHIHNLGLVGAVLQLGVRGGGVG